MKKIAFDVMGNDNGVEAAIIASMQFVKKYNDYAIVLVGDENLINKTLIPHERISVVNNPNDIDKTSSLRSAHLDNNSMTTTLKLLKEGEVDACLSSGDSGRLMISSIFLLKRLKGISRPAFMPIFPCIIKDKKFVMLDVGANLDINAEHLVQWAKLGVAFASTVLKAPNPRVSILNVGTEDDKGFEAHHVAHAELKKLKETNEMNYLGFIEGRDILEGKVDVIVSDGYAGNIALKSMEGAILNFQKIIKENSTSNIFRKINALMLKKAFNNIKEHLDYRNVGAAWIIGVDGIIIKCHGSSDAKAYQGALMQLKQGLDMNALEEFKKVL